MHNDAYVAVLNTDNANESGVSVSVSHDGGKTFGLPVSVYDDTSGKVFSDKPWIGVDNTSGPHQGDIYVVWSYDHNNPCGTTGQSALHSGVGFLALNRWWQDFRAGQVGGGYRALLHNPTDGRPSDSRKCDAVLGATPAILPNGTLAVAFAYVDLNATDPDSGAAPTKNDDRQPLPTKMLVVTSPDGGATWTNPSLIAAIYDLPVTFPLEHYRNFSLPAFASDPKTGQLYLTWADEQNSDADILLATSKDSGVDMVLTGTRQ